MAISDGVRAALLVSGKKQKDLMEVFDTTKQGISTKVTKDRWFGRDLVKVAELVGADLAFVFPNGSIIKLENDSQDNSESQDA